MNSVEAPIRMTWQISKENKEDDGRRKITFNGHIISLGPNVIEYSENIGKLGCRIGHPFIYWLKLLENREYIVEPIENNVKDISYNKTDVIIDQVELINRVERLTNAGYHIIDLISRISDQATDEQRIEHEMFVSSVAKIWNEAKKV